MTQLMGKCSNVLYAVLLRKTRPYSGKNDKRNVRVAIGTTTALPGFPQPV